MVANCEIMLKEVIDTDKTLQENEKWVKQNRPELHFLCETIKYYYHENPIENALYKARNDNNPITRRSPGCLHII